MSLYTSGGKKGVPTLAKLAFQQEADNGCTIKDVIK